MLVLFLELFLLLFLFLFLLKELTRSKSFAKLATYSIRLTMHHIYHFLCIDDQHLLLRVTERTLSDHIYHSVLSLKGSLVEIRFIQRVIQKECFINGF